MFLLRPIRPGRVQYKHCMSRMLGGATSEAAFPCELKPEYFMKLETRNSAISIEIMKH